MNFIMLYSFQVCSMIHNSCRCNNSLVLLDKKIISEFQNWTWLVTDRVRAWDPSDLKSGKINNEMFLTIDTFTLYFTTFYFQNLNKQKYLFTFIVLRSSCYSTKIALKWTKIMLQKSVIPIWNPENQGYKIGYI